MGNNRIFNGCSEPRFVLLNAVFVLSAAFVLLNAVKNLLQVAIDVDPSYLGVTSMGNNRIINGFYGPHEIR